VYQLHAALNPPALGHVDATVKVDGTNIEVVLVAHTPKATSSWPPTSTNCVMPSAKEGAATFS